MGDRFDTTLERKLESSADETERGIAGVRRIELITGAERRRRWSNDDKARIVVESFVPGATVSDVARRNGLSPQQLFGWRREARSLFQDDVAAAAIVEVSAQAVPVVEAVGKTFCELRTLGHLGETGFEPGLQGFDHWLGALLA